MNNPVDKLKSYSPVVKKTSHDALRQQMSFYYEHTKNLEKRDEEWAREVRNLRLEIQRIKEYDKWMVLNYPKQDELSNQRDESNKFKYRPLISVILPVYNTDPDYLKVCIESVLNQSYTNWELCINDDASTSQATVKTLNDYADNPRIKINHSEKNGHISVASNEAISMAEGEFIALLDHDDFLWPNALYENIKLLQDHPDAVLIYSDEDKIDESPQNYVHFSPYFKPDWSPHLLECVNYITHFAVIRTEMVRKIGGFDRNMVGAQDWDLFFRVTEQTDKIYHIPTILYSWRAHDGSTAKSMESKSYAKKNQARTIKQHLSRTNIPIAGILTPKYKPGIFYLKYLPKDSKKVSIIIPTKDKKEYLEHCLSSIVNKTTYDNYEIVIVDTGSKEKETLDYYAHLKVAHSKRMRIVYWRHSPFNYSDACNFGAKKAQGEYLIMLNNDTEVISPSWIQDMLGYADQPDVGAVGVKLLFPTNQIQHAGVTVGIGAEKPVAGHPGVTIDSQNNDSITSLYVDVTRDVSAVTAACLMISKHKFWEVGGFEPIFRVTFNDVDLNLKLLKRGYKNIYLPFVELYHHESISVGRVFKNRDMQELKRSGELMRKKWKGWMDSDPYYNKNYYKLSPNFGLDIYTKK